MLYWLTLTVSDYNNTNLAEIGWYAIAIAGLSVLTGVSGQISLGHGAFVAVGAYAAGLMMEHFDLPLVVPLLVAVGVAAVLGAVVGMPAARLTGPYLAAVTLALALAVQALPAKFSSVFNGDQGIIVNPPTPPHSVPAERWLAWITLFAALVTMVVLANFLRSRFGRALRAVRDDEIAAAASGLSPARVRVLAFAVSAGERGSRRGPLRPLERDRVPGQLHTHSLHPAARRHGDRWQRDAHGGVVGRGGARLRPPVEHEPLHPLRISRAASRPTCRTRSLACSSS